MKVLVAEDDGVCRFMVEALLSSSGYDVVTAADGTTAWEILAENTTPLVAILDWMMPGMNGPDICRKLRDELTEAPVYVILLTGLEGKEMLVKGLESGANDYIVKPFQKEELLARVNVGRRVVELQGASATRVEELRQQQQELTRLNRALKVLREVGRTIATAATEADLLRDVCMIISSSGGYREAWVGHAASGDDSIVPIAYHSQASEGNFSSLLDTDGVCEALPTYKSLAADSCHCASSLSLPLVSGEQTVGVLTIHSDEIGSFDAEERLLLEELASELAYGIVSLRSQSESRMAELRIAESERFAKSTLDALPNQIAILDESGRIIAVNRTWRSCAGESGFVSDKTREGTDYLSFCTNECSVQELNGNALAHGIRQVLATDIPHFSMEYSTKIGNVTSWYMTRVAPFHGEGAPRVVVIHEDISELKRAEIEIERLAYSDPLTGLPNRTLFRDRLEQVLAQSKRNNGIAALMFIDLDHFKVINDTLGHSTGDLLLQGVAGRIFNRIRKTDTVARMGGDEFVLLMNGIRHPEDAAHAAKSILESLHQPFLLGGQEVFVTASIGIALFPMDGTDGDTLLKNADIAMYYAKERGRNAHQFYTPIMNAKAEERLSIESSLRRALERDELLLHFQPWYDLKQEKISGMEALIRWKSPTQGIVKPEKFIPLAEETGLIVPIGEWVLHEACKHIRRIEDEGIPAVTVSVNLSGRQLKQPDLLETLQNILKETGIDPRRLELELTETSIMENAEETIKTLHAIKDMGIRLSIDDFGTGYSSLNYLKRFPIDKLKIDRSFVCEIPTDEGDMGIIRAIIAFAQSMKMKVIAEGVENIAQLAFLSAHRCNEIQGYFVSKPICQEDIFKLLHHCRVDTGGVQMTCEEM